MPYKFMEVDRTFESTNLLIVAIMSLCPSTSSSEFGRYFSTLKML